MATPSMLVTYRGATAVLRDLCKERGIAFTTAWGRIRKGWSPDDAIDTPVKQPGIRHTNGRGYCRLNGSRQIEHIAIAERAIGRTLPAGAEVHHVNGDRSDNRPENLVVCPSHAYHALLHMRQRALDACGNASFRRCEFCGEWSDPSEMLIRKARAGAAHKTCANAARTERKRAARAKKEKQS